MDAQDEAVVEEGQHVGSAPAPSDEREDGADVSTEVSAGETLEHTTAAAVAQPMALPTGPPSTQTVSQVVSYGRPPPGAAGRTSEQHIRDILLRALDRIQTQDVHHIFAEPVDPVAVPQYRQVIEHPMDLGTVRDKVLHDQYRSFPAFVRDCDLIWDNCFRFNPTDSIFYRAAQVCRREAKTALRRARDRFRAARDPVVHAFMGNDNDNVVAASASRKRPRMEAPQGNSAPSPRVTVVAAEGTPTTSSCADTRHSWLSEAVPGAIALTESTAGKRPPDSDIPAAAAASHRISALLPADISPAVSPYPPGSGGPLPADLAPKPNALLQGTQPEALTTELARLWPQPLLRISSSLMALLDRVWHQLTLLERQRLDPARSAARWPPPPGAASASSTWRMAQAHREALSSLAAVSRPPYVRPQSPYGVTAAPLDSTPAERLADGDAAHALLSTLPYRPNPCRPRAGQMQLPLLEYRRSLVQFMTGERAIPHWEQRLAAVLSPYRQLERYRRAARAQREQWQTARRQALQREMEQWTRACRAVSERAAQRKQAGADDDWIRDAVLDAPLAEHLQIVPLNMVNVSAPYGISMAELLVLRKALAEPWRRAGLSMNWLDRMVEHTRRALREVNADAAGSATTGSERGGGGGGVTSGVPSRIGGGEAVSRMPPRMPVATAAPGGVAASRQTVSRGEAVTAARVPRPPSLTPEAWNTAARRVTPGTGNATTTNTATRPGGTAPPRHHLPSASGYGGSLSASVYIGRCANCGTTETPGWRQGETADQRLCNACGLFWAKYRKQRPGHLWKKEVDKRAAMTAAAAAAASRPVSRAPTAERSTTTTTGTATGTAAAATVATATRASPHTEEQVHGVRPRQENAPDPTP